jgi:branched-chain amino acid transport system substrate-binding protein
MKKSTCVMKRTLFLGVFPAIVILILCHSILRAAEPIRMGMVASISGWGGFVGNQQRDAVMAVVEDINHKGGVLGRPIEVLIEDDRSMPTTAVIAATKLVRDLKVVALIGPTLPDSGMAMIPISEQEQMPFVVGVPLPGDFKKWSFHLGPSEENTAEATLEMAVNLTKGKRIALIYEGTNIGKTGAKIFTRDISHYPGASLVAKETFEITDTSMISQMTNLRAAKADVLVVYAGGSAAAIIARNYKQLGMTVPVVTANVAQGPDFIKLGGQVAEEAGWIIPVLKMSLLRNILSMIHLEKLCESLQKRFSRINMERTNNSPYTTHHWSIA